MIERHATLSREADHRLLNNLQMVSSLLLMQGRASVDADCSSALAIAADRVLMIARIHRHLHSIDGIESVAFKGFIEALGRHFETMLTCAGPLITVECAEVQLPAATAVPLGFVVNELITNALKHGQAPIVVRLTPEPLRGFALCVENGGPALPESFDPAKSRGLGMRIVRSLVEVIGGELCTSRGAGDQGARFTVLFAAT